MKMPFGSDPYEYVSKMRTLTESVTSLKIDTDSVLQYFFWMGMNETFKTQLVQMTNKTKPSLKEINDNFFDATERYLVVTKNFRYKKQGEINDKKAEPKEISNFAVNIDVEPQKFRSCCLCARDNGKEADHPIYKCKVYESPKAKVDKLKSLSGCLKCASLGHHSGQCKFRFRRKCSCNQWHFSFLCIDRFKGSSDKSSFVPNSFKSFPTPKGSDPTSKPKVDLDTKQKDKGNSRLKEISNNSIYLVDALPNVLDGNSILPTFTCRINGNCKIRALKDLGCQSNFITEQLADSQKLKVVQENVVFKVKGFNSNKEYDTRIVEVEIKIGAKVHSIRAICVPEINISLKLPKLPVITKAFIEKGYTLADQNL